MDFEVAIRALEDSRVAFPRNPWGIANRSRAPSIAHSKRIKSAIWMRLEDENLFSPHDTSGVAGKMAVLYASLPNEAVSGDREKLEELANDPVRRVKLDSMLEQLAGFGPSSAPTYLNLMNDARKYRNLKPDPFGNLNSWHRPYLAGLKGLCKMGSADATTIRQLFTELDASFEGGWVGYDRLAINALTGMGASPDEIWEHAKQRKLTAYFSAAQLRDEFDHLVRRAQSRVDCTY